MAFLIPRVRAALILIALSGCSSAHGGSSPSRPILFSAAAPRSGTAADVQLSDALQAATTYTSTHLAIAYTGDLTGSTDVDAGAGAGLQRTTTSATTLQVRCRPDACYALTDAAGLGAPPFSLTPSAAAERSGHWLRVRPASATYDQLRSGVVLAAALGSIRLTGPLIDAGSTEVDGVPVEAIKGLDPAGRQAETVYVSHDTGLPTGFLEVGATRTTTGTFSGWGEAIVVPVPARVTALP